MKFEIGEPLDIKVNKNIYLLEIENTHGDADAESYSYLRFRKEHETDLKLIIEFLNWCQNDRPNREEITERSNEVSNATSDDLWNCGLNNDEYFIHSDARYEGYCCRPRLNHLTWYDENGNGFKVNIV